MGGTKQAESNGDARPAAAEKKKKASHCQWHELEVQLLAVWQSGSGESPEREFRYSPYRYSSRRMSSGGAGAASGSKKNILVLFDVDGTLTPARKAATPRMLEFLSQLRQHVHTGMVGGSDLSKQVEQLGEGVLHMFDYVFPENGLRAYKDGAPIGKTSFLEKLGEERYQELVNFVLGYLSTLKIPKKRGTFIEFRTGMINVSPIGRNCSQEERDEFEQYDKAHNVRAAMIAALQAKFPDFDLKYSIGGQISFDVFPVVSSRGN